ncbi:glycosyltransferase family 2 protein [Aurantibacter sp.]|uniref:glycosyltransferase family 2 protein n=1 Tax=Aurantibacter sp. TaxID=2807103 RepID=UPI0035C7B340
MIIAIHNNDILIDVLDKTFASLSFKFIKTETLTASILRLSEVYKDELLIWCHQDQKSVLNLNSLDYIFHHKRVLASFNPSDKNYIHNGIGYVERSFYLKIKKENTFTTWLMSDSIGGINTSTLLALKNLINPKNSLNYTLNSIAKASNVLGLFCYSEPKLVNKNINSCNEKPSIPILFKFVKEHYKWVWTWYLLLAFIVFEKRFLLFSFLKTIFSKQKHLDFDLETIKVASKRQVITSKEIDVIIPTMGRKSYLYNVLKDFSTQTILPKRIIIVEQNPDPKSVTELDYIKKEEWPFHIIHKFTHQTGVVNARNEALKEVKSEWTFLGDDDNRFNSTLIEDLFTEIENYGTQVGTTVYLQPKEVQTYLKTAQTSIFGAGNAILKTSLLDNVAFNKVYEFNYGEDNDFGMQLRLQGEDVVYFASIKVTHLKAPIGGYRTKVAQAWANEKIKPLPSPTIQFLYQSYFTSKQLLGYKLLLGLRQLKSKRSINIIRSVKLFNKQWKQSQLWSTKLK